MASSAFYERAIALNRDRHQKLRIDIQPDHYAFAAKTNALPIASTEFVDIGREYPIVFVDEGGGNYHVAALLGLRDNENLFVDEKGQWQADTYVPAFARRYPFILAGAQDADRFVVCVDEAYAGLGESKGTALFGDDGKESEYMQRIIGFLKAYHDEITRTGLFAKRIAELGLLEQKVITLEKNGVKQTLRGLAVIDDERYAALPDAEVLSLFRAGYMGWIDMHRMSMANVMRLAQRLDASNKLVGEESPKSPTTTA